MRTAGAALIVLGVAAAIALSCSDPLTNADPRVIDSIITPGIRVVPGALAFDTIAIGTTRDSVLTITSTESSETLRVTSVTFDNAAMTAGFSLVAPLSVPFALTPGTDSGIVVRFAPSRTGAVSGRAAIAYARLGRSYTIDISLSGTGKVPARLFTALTPSFDFGQVMPVDLLRDPQGGSWWQLLQARYIGATPFDTSQAFISMSGDASPFRLFVVLPPRAQLLTGDTISLYVAFVPPGVGAHIASIDLFGPSQGASIAVRGTGATTGFPGVPDTLAFADVVGGTMATDTAWFVNSSPGITLQVTMDPDSASQRPFTYFPQGVLNTVSAGSYQTYVVSCATPAGTDTVLTGSAPLRWYSFPSWREKRVGFRVHAR